MQVPEIDIKQLFENVNYMTKTIIDSSDTYKDFLRWSGGFINSQGNGEGFTIANQLLIYGFNNNARLCYDEAAWNSKGISIVRPEEPIHIMRKVSGGNGFADRVVYDISTTNAPGLRNIVVKDQGSMCEALIRSSPCRIEFNLKKGLPPGKADYSYKDNTIYVGKGYQTFLQVFAELCRVYSHYYICQADKDEHQKKYENASSQKPKQKEVFFVQKEGKYYQLSPTDIIKTDKDGREFIIDTDSEGNPCRRLVIRKLIDIPDEENNVPEFTYNKAKNNAKAVEITYSVMSSINLDTSIFSDFNNLSWKSMDLSKVRDDLNMNCNTARTIKDRYEENLISLGAAEYMNSQMESGVE